MSTTIDVRVPRPRFKAGWLQAVEDFCEDLAQRGYSPFTLRDYRADLVRLGACIGIGPADLSAEHVTEARDRDRASGLQELAVRRRAAAYQHFLDFLLARDDRPIVHRLFERLPGFGLEHRVLMGLITAAGLRLQEVALLEARDVDLKRGEVRCRSALRLLPLSQPLWADLRELLAVAPRLTHRPLLPGWQGFPPNIRTLHARVLRVAADAQLSGHLRPDRLRREAARRLTAAGAAPGLVVGFLGQDRGRPVAPRRGELLDLSGLRPRLEALYPAAVAAPTDSSSSHQKNHEDIRIGRGLRPQSL